MTTTYDKELDEFVCTCAAGEFFGNTAAEAEKRAYEALRIAGAHEKKNKGVGR